jgi:hypothetical protein
MYTQSQKTGMPNNAKVFRSMKTKEFKEDIQHWLRLLIPDRQELLFPICEPIYEPQLHMLL